MRTVAMVVSLFVVAILPKVARPEAASVEDARRFFAAGRQAYEAGQYVVAITAFEEAHRLAPRASIVFALAQALRRQYVVDHDPGKIERAVTLYRDYLAKVSQGERRDEAVGYLLELEPIWLRVKAELDTAAKARPAGPGAAASALPLPQKTQLMISSLTRGAKAAVDGGKLSEVPVITDVKPGRHKIHVQAKGCFSENVEGVAVEGHLIVVEVNLREMPGSLAVRALTDAEILVDGRLLGKTPLTQPLTLPAGKHWVTLAKRGHYPHTTKVTLAKGQSLEVDGRLEATTQRRISYSFLVASLATAVAGGITLGLAYRADQQATEIQTQATQDNISPAERLEFNRHLDRRNDLLATSYLVLGGAAALATTGALLYWIDNPRVESQPSGPKAPLVDPLGLAWSARF